ncbi:hypothetical protein [Pseudomonas anguilliseptica]|uniref:hypothetical protein n=1 Tax=Pseudomonas anguilliseptica TaxID=53406 RepID=UPI00325BE08B
MSIEVEGMWYERAWQWAKEHLTITVPGAVLIFAATYILMLAVNAGEVGAAWVQAVGSVAAIGVAIFISGRQHAHDQMKATEAALDAEIGKSVRLNHFAREVHQTLEGIVAAVYQPGVELLDQKNARSFELFRERINSNFDDDIDELRLMCAWNIRHLLNGVILVLGQSTALNDLSGYGAVRDKEIAAYLKTSESIVSTTSLICDHWQAIKAARFR